MENNQKPIRNDKLLEAIKNMQENNSDENVNRMIDCVMEANFITPGNVSRPKNIAKNSGGNTVMQQQTQIQFQLIENQKGEKFFPAETVILALGVKPLWEEVDALSSFAGEFYQAGDCRKPRSIMDATGEAWTMANLIGRY